MSDTRQLCTFFVDDLYLAVDVLEVQEVIRYQDLTVVPLAPEAVRGLINLRGQIVTAIDMRTMLDLPPLPEGCFALEPLSVTTEALVRVIRSFRPCN